MFDQLLAGVLLPDALQQLRLPLPAQGRWQGVAAPDVVQLRRRQQPHPHQQPPPLFHPVLHGFFSFQPRRPTGRCIPSPALWGKRQPAVRHTAPPPPPSSRCAPPAAVRPPLPPRGRGSDGTAAPAPPASWAPAALRDAPAPRGPAESGPLLEARRPTAPETPPALAPRRPDPAGRFPCRRKR